MECLSPLSLPRPNGLGSIDRVCVPCGKCYPCLAKKRSQWSFRLTQELKKAKTSHFVTLTYDENNKVSKVNKRHLQLFLKRLRKDIEKLRVNTKYNLNGLYEAEKIKIKYFLTAEYGTQTKRPHYHGIFFNIPNEKINLIEKNWGLGFVSIGTVTPKSINYVTKYIITKEEEFEKNNDVFNLMSLGLGKCYLTKDVIKYHQKTQNYYSVVEGGKKIDLPRYYKNKLFGNLSKENHQKKLIKELDKKIVEEYDRIEKLGNNLGSYLHGQKEQYINHIKNNLSKKATL